MMKFRSVHLRNSRLQLVKLKKKDMILKKTLFLIGLLTIFSSVQCYLPSHWLLNKHFDQVPSDQEESKQPFRRPSSPYYFYEDQYGRIIDPQTFEVVDVDKALKEMERITDEINKLPFLEEFCRM